VRLDATLNAGAVWAEGRSTGKAVAFNGDSSHVQLPVDLFQDLGDFTLTLWVYANELRRDTCLLYVGQDNLAFMRLVPSGDNFMFSICASGWDDQQVVAAPNAMAQHRWVHVAVTLQGTTARLYQDGELMGTQESMLLSPRQLGDQIRLLGWSPINSAFNGRMQDFRLYAGALTAEEIKRMASS
jgi:hypothetical protein